MADTSLLIGTMNKAVLFNYKSQKISNIFSGRKDISDIHTHVIFHDNDGNYWLGTRGRFIYFQHPKRENIGRRETV